MPRIASLIIVPAHCALPPDICRPNCMIVGVPTIGAHIVNIDIGTVRGPVYSILKDSIPLDLLNVMIRNPGSRSLDIHGVTHTSVNIHVREAMIDSPLVNHIGNDVKNDRVIDNNAVVSCVVALVSSLLGYEAFSLRASASIGAIARIRASTCVGAIARAAFISISALFNAASNGLSKSLVVS